MSRSLQTGNPQQMRPRVSLSEISNDLGLSDKAVHELQDIGIRSAEDFLGLIYSGFRDVAQELGISTKDLYEISRELRKYIDPYVLRQIEELRRSLETFSTGAELGPPPNPDKIPEYEEE